MSYAYNEKEEKRNNGRKRTAQLRKHQIVWRNKIQMTGNMRNRRSQAEMKEKLRSISEEHENPSKPNPAVESSSKK